MPDLAAALTRARGVIDGLVAAIPNTLVALAVFAVALLLSAIVKRVVARLTETRLHSHRNAGLAVGRLAQGVVLFIGLLVALSVALPTFQPGDVIQVLGSAASRSVSRFATSCRISSPASSCS